MNRIHSIPALERRLPAALLAALLLVSLTTATADEKPPTAKTVAGVPILVLEGDHYKRGYAHGKALRSQILDLVDNYILERTSPLVFYPMLQSVGELMVVDPGLEEEAKGLVQGARDAGDGTFKSDRLPAAFTWRDILAINTYIDYLGSACSSVSAWGAATQAPPLTGKGALVRNLDWSLSPALLRNQVVFVHKPSEKGKAAMVSVGFAGFLGCLSCINSEGLGVFLNLGFSSRSGKFPPSHRFTPSALALRTAVETLAMDGVPGDKTTQLEYFVKKLTDTVRVGSFIIHAIAPRTGPAEPALVVELVAGGHAVRTTEDQPEGSSFSLTATNHNRKLSPPVDCTRYAKAQEFLKKNKTNLGPDSLWELRNLIKRSDTMQSLLFVPATGEVWFSFRKPAPGKKKKGKRSNMSEVEKTTLEELFKLTP